MTTFLKNIWSTLLQNINRLFTKPPVPLKTVKVEELPDILDPMCVYIVGESSYLWFVAMLCPCGCGAVLQMSVMPEKRPQWDITIHEDRTITLYPSVRRVIGCKSHFFLRRGMILWCKEKMSPTSSFQTPSLRG